MFHLRQIFVNTLDNASNKIQFCTISKEQESILVTLYQESQQTSSRCTLLFTVDRSVKRWPIQLLYLLKEVSGETNNPDSAKTENRKNKVLAKKLFWGLWVYFAIFITFVFFVTGSLTEYLLHSLIFASVQNPSQPGKMIDVVGLFGVFLIKKSFQWGQTQCPFLLRKCLV